MVNARARVRVRVRVGAKSRQPEKDGGPDWEEVFGNQN